MANAKLRRKWGRELSQHWQSKGVLQYCEIRLPGCFGTYGLSPAHSKDRDEIHTREDFFEVVCSCNYCHQYADQKMAKEDRVELFKAIIQRREDAEI